MQVFIPATSPLITYQPSRAAWTPGTNGTGMFTFANQSAVFNFTGTGFHFHVDYASVNASRSAGPGSSSEGSLFWNTRLVVNGTEVGQGSAAMGVDSLPPGRHFVELQFTRLDGNTTRDSYAFLRGVRGTLADNAGPGAWNQTLDDNVRNTSVVVTGPWSRLSADEAAHRSTVTNDTIAALERPTLPLSYAGTLAVAEAPGAAVQVTFAGQAVWVYGAAGGAFGQYAVSVDGRDAGTYGAPGGNASYAQLLYHTSGLGEGEHRLRLTSVSGRIGFDRLVAAHGLGAGGARTLGTLAVPTTTVGVTPAGFKPIPTSAAPSRAPAAKADDNTVAIAASVGAIGGLIALTALAFLLWICCRRRRARKHTRPSPYLPPPTPEPQQGPRWQFRKSRGWKFEQLEPAHSEWKNPSTSSFGSSYREPRSPPKVRSKSLFSSRAAKHSTGAGPGPGDYGMQPLPAPSPMSAALGGRASPLSALGKWRREPHYNKASEISAPLPLGANFGQPEARGHGRAESGGSLGSDIRNWYEWFGGVYAGSGSGGSHYTRRTDVGVAS